MPTNPTYNHAPGYALDWQYREAAPLYLDRLPRLWFRVIQSLQGHTFQLGSGYSTDRELGAREAARSILQTHILFDNDAPLAWQDSELPEIRAVMNDRGDAQSALDEMRGAIVHAALAYEGGNDVEFDVACYDMHYYAHQAIGLMVRYYEAEWNGRIAHSPDTGN